MTKTTTTTTVHTYRPAIFVTQIVNIVFGIIELLFAVRIVLELFGASASSEFVAWIYGVSGALLGPFIGAFQSISIGNGGVIDIVAILGMIVYAIIGWIILQILLSLFGNTRV